MTAPNSLRRHAALSTRTEVSTRKHTRTGLSAVAAVGVALVLLSGCKSANSQGNNPAPGAPPAAPTVPPGSGSASPGATGSADFGYGGSENNTVHLTSSTCTVSGGNVVSFRTPAQGGSNPALSGTKSGQSWTLTLATATHANGYTVSTTSAVTTSDNSGVWQVRIGGATLSTGSASVTLSGTVLCGRSA